MTHIELLNSKIFTWETLKSQIAEWQKQGKKIVFSNGCFDLVHKGHIDYLNRAADLGDVLVMGLNTDASVSKLKGLHRPIQDEQSRLTIIAALQCVNAVVLFDEETPYELIKLVQPDVLVKGSDYKPENIVGYDIVIAKGGQVKTIDYLPGFSTSGIEKRIKEA
ncbi:MAG: D-glycero-beta-D-manno-heptose 1-phosphate adenylyltransferase [Bacteroidia bacterium]|nr:D-glycero-beta-D-manno-heptose 1-phosphate adenylyltransferase [Bacteroidia bacterium]